VSVDLDRVTEANGDSVSARMRARRSWLPTVDVAEKSVLEPMCCNGNELKSKMAVSTFRPLASPACLPTEQNRPWPVEEAHRELKLENLRGDARIIRQLRFPVFSGVLS
jgi:hypothetical protein